MMFADYFIDDYDRKEIISFVGGGGKTSSLFKLAKELKAKNKKVLVTTTTKIFVPEAGDFDTLIITPQPGVDILKPAEGTITVWGRNLLAKGEKLEGIEPVLIDSVFAAGSFDYLLVEADGAKQKPVKAPAAHEPVIPSFTNKTVGIIGLSALNKKVDTEVFRNEIFKSICGDSPILNLEQIFRLITHPEGLFKNTPEHSGKYLFLNQVEGEPLKKAAFILINMLDKAEFYLDGLIIGSLREEIFYQYPERKHVTGIIMAAGFSRRMGQQDKLLLKLDSGVLLIEKIIKEALASDLDEVILVYQNPQVGEIGKKYGIKTFFNPEAVKGQSVSVKIGVENAHSKTNGYMFIPGDMPFLDKKLINKLLFVFRNSNFPIIVPYYDKHPGMPAVFSAFLKPELLGITGDEGGRSIIRKNSSWVKCVPIRESFKGLDIDTPEEFEKYTYLSGDEWNC